ncbi:unnamed protein product [Sphagnum troendelagicum]
MASDTLNNAKTLKKLSAPLASQQKPDRTTTPFRNACSQLRRCRCLTLNKHALLLPVPLHHPEKNSIINPTGKRLDSHLVHTFIVMQTVKHISQSRMPFPSLQTAPGTTVIGQETQFMHLLMSNEASPPSHLQQSHLLFPGRSPAQSITTTPPLLTAPSSDPRFSSTTTSELHLRPTCASPRRQLPSSAVRLAVFNECSSCRTMHDR